MEKRDPSCIIGGNVNWYSLCEEQYRGLLGCPPQAYKPCACPIKTKERTQNQQQRHQWFNWQGVGVRGGRKAYISEARTWSNTPPCAVDTWWGMVAIFTPGSKGHLPGVGELRSGGLVSYQGNSRGHAPHSPFDKNNY